MPDRPVPAKRRRTILVAMVLALLGGLAPFSVGRAEDEDRVPGAVWHFWFHDGGNLYDEAYSSLKDCETAAKTWNQESPKTPIAFPCAKESRRLLVQAWWRCKKGEPLACIWRTKLKKLLAEDEEEEEARERH